MAEEPREPEIHQSARIHKTAMVHPSAIIGENVKIGPRVKIGAGATIGADTRIDEAAEIGKNVNISNGNVRIAHHARVGDETRIESEPRTPRIKAAEHALDCLKNDAAMKGGKLPHHLMEMDDRLQWSVDGDGKLKVSMDAGYDSNGKRINTEFTDPEELDRWLDENAPTFGERTDPNANRTVPMQMGDPGPRRKPDYTIGPESHVGNDCVIETGCHMGANVRIGDAAYLQHNARLEDNIEIQSGKDKLFDDGTGELRSTHIGPGTKVEADVRMDKGCWIGAGCHVRAECRLGANTLVDGFTIVDDGAEIPKESRIGFNELTKGYNNVAEEANRKEILEGWSTAKNEIEQLAELREAGGASIAPKARVDAKAEVHPEATVMNGAQIEAGAKIGKGAVIGVDVSVGSGCTIGDGAIIAAKTSVRDRSHVGDNVEIERRCVIRSDAKLHDCPSGTKPTRIGAKTLIAGSEIEPEVRIEPGSQTDYNAKIKRGALIEAFCRIQGEVGENATVRNDSMLMHGSVVGEKATIGEKAVVWPNSEVEKSAVVEPGRMVPGSPEDDEKNKVRIKAPTAEPSRQENPVRGKGRAVGGTPAPAPSRDHARTR